MDTQLFLTLPVLVVVAFLNQPAGLLICSGLAAASLIAAGIFAYRDGWSMNGTDTLAYNPYHERE